MSSKQPVASGTELQVSTDPFFTKLVNENDDGSPRTSQAFAQDELPSGVDLYVRVRYTSDDVGRTSWSPYVRFMVEVPANIVGICYDAKSVTVNYIDVNGNKLTSFDPSKHPVFANASMAILDSNRNPVTMTKIPKFWVKTAASGPLGSYAEGKPCWWISDISHPGFRVHPAFKRSTQRDGTGNYRTSDYCYIGTYLGHVEKIGDITVLGSKKDQLVKTSCKHSELVTFAIARNDFGVGETGYHGTDIYEYSVIRLLGAICKRTFDFQSVYGTNSTKLPRSGMTNAKLILRGTPTAPQVWIDDLQNTYWQYVELINIVDGVVKLKSPMDRATAVNLAGAASNYTVSRTSGWIKTFLSHGVMIGDDMHDLLELFLPATVSSSDQDVNCPDYHDYNTDSDELKIGGSWESSDRGGLFATTMKREYETDTVLVPGQPAYDKNYLLYAETCNLVNENGYLGYDNAGYADYKTNQWDNAEPCSSGYGCTTNGYFECPKGWPQFNKAMVDAGARLSEELYKSGKRRYINKYMNGTYAYEGCKVTVAQISEGTEDTTETVYSYREDMALRLSKS